MECLPSGDVNICCCRCKVTTTARKGTFVAGTLMLIISTLFFSACLVVLGLKPKITSQINEGLKSLKQNHSGITDYEFQTEETFLVSNRILIIEYGHLLKFVCIQGRFKNTSI